MSRDLRIRPVEGIPEVEPGMDLGALIAERCDPDSANVVVVAQKVVSKSEGRIVDLAGVQPGSRATELALTVDKDARLVELILAETRAIVRQAPGVLVVETHAGWICANAGIDASNVPGDERVLLLPLDADASARRIRGAIATACGARPAVVITDSFGRPWRVGQTDVAIGAAGIPALDDWRGRPDREGRELAAAAPALVDQIASAADLARGKNDGNPVVLISGLGDHITDADGPGAVALQRPADSDLFR